MASPSAELINRAFRSDYTATETKVVLVPGCMRGRSPEECEAERVKEGLMCKGCLSSCHVNQLREMGRKQNFEVYIIPHASDLSLWGPWLRKYRHFGGQRPDKHTWRNT